MKKFITAVATSAMLLPGVVNAEETSVLPLNEDVETDIINEAIGTENVDFFYDSLVLKKEEYNGTLLIRWMEWNKSEKEFVQLFNVPESISKQVDVDDENAVAKVTALLAQYYTQDSTDNIVRLNELLFAYDSTEPNSKFSVSKEYAHSFAENLKFVLEAVNEEVVIDISDEEVELLNENTWGTVDNVPYSSKEELYEATELLYEELREKWYEKTSTYIILGATVSILTASAFIVYKRR